MTPSNKKQRLSAPEESGAEEEEEEQQEVSQQEGMQINNDEEEEEQEEAEAAAADEAMEDALDDAEEGEEEEEEEEGADGNEASKEEEEEISRRANTESAAPRRINRPGRSAMAGIIKTVRVENFMCHRSLEVHFNRNVTFIHGQNGSGKSAILAALQICLGAGARKTHRAANMKELVRKDGAQQATQAVVRVTLLNEGDDGYKNDIYGDAVTVERTISTTNGMSGYKLLDVNGKCISKKKSDLEDLLDQLNIQIDNPVAILDQEESKKFLTGKAEEKYNFFLKATELERVDASFARIMGTLEEMNASSISQEKAMDIAAMRRDELEKKWEQHKQLDKLEQKILETQVKYSWALYSKSNAEYEESLDKMRAFQEKAAKQQEKLTQAEEAKSQPDATGEARTQRVNDLIEESQQQAYLKRQLEEELKSTTQPMIQKDRQLRSVKENHRNNQAALKDAKKRLKDKRDEIIAKAGSAESEQAQRTEALGVAEEDLESRRQKAPELKQAVGSAYREYEELEPQVDEARTRVKQIDRQFHAARNSVRDLESSGNDSVGIFGPRVVKVHGMVEKAKCDGLFQGPVIGPIGAHVKMVQGKDKYSQLAELALGNGTLDRFIVTNDSDRRLLQDIRNKAGCQSDCGVFQVKQSRRYAVPDPPAEGIETVASVLNITDDTVFNCMVDNGKIETIGLADSKDESQDKLLVNNGSSYSIKGSIKSVYHLPRGDQWNVRGGQLQIISNEKKARRLISSDKSAALSAAKQEVEQLKSELGDAKKEESRLEHEHTKYQREWNKAKRAMQDNDQRIMSLKDQIDQLQMEMETTVDSDQDTSYLEEEVKQCEQACEATQQQREKIEAELAELKPAVDDVKKRLSVVSKRNLKVMDDLAAAEKDMENFLNTQSQQDDAIRKKREKLDKYKHAIELHTSKLDSCQAERAASLEKARRVQFKFQHRQSRANPDVESSQDADEEGAAEPTEEELEAIQPQMMTKDAEYYEARIEQQKEKVKQERQRRKVNNEDPAEAHEKFLEAQKELDGLKAERKALRAKMRNLKGDMKLRRRRWQQFREVLETTAGTMFGNLLSMNKYSGSLIFDHDEKTLGLKVQKDAGQRGSNRNDVKALSGGERSYTTMCLLLALGEKLETPFRILDEFDVFLDPQVRKLTIKQLIHVAKTMEHRQFIFITPQDLSGIDEDPQLKILPLRPPEKRDIASALSQQTLHATQG